MFLFVIFAAHFFVSTCPTSPPQSGFAYDRDLRVVVESPSALGAKVSDWALPFVQAPTHPASSAPRLEQPPLSVRAARVPTAAAPSHAGAAWNRRSSGRPLQLRGRTRRAGCGRRARGSVPASETPSCAMLRTALPCCGAVDHQVQASAVMCGNPAAVVRTNHPRAKTCDDPASARPQRDASRNTCTHALE